MAQSLFSYEEDEISYSSFFTQYNDCGKYFFEEKEEQMSYYNERKLSLLSLAAASFYSSFWPIEVAKNKSPLLPFLRIAVITACLDDLKLMT